MRKLILFNMISLDGYFEGSSREIDWHNVDDEFNDFAAQQLDSVDILLFGRITYELMAGYWPAPEVIKSDPLISKKINSKAKIVFSRTLEKAEWNNTRIIKDKASE